MSYVPFDQLQWSPEPCRCPCCQPRSFTTTLAPIPQEPEPLSDEDVERIARRLAELLRDQL